MVGATPLNLIPKFCNGGVDNLNGTEENEIRVDIGTRIKCGDDVGTVKYIGDVHGYKGVWYGVEWDNPSRGKHDGSVEGIQYFKTSKLGSGSFIRPNKVAPTISCAEAIKKYYGDREDETVAAHRRTIINEWKRKMKAPFVEMVGFEKIHQKQKFDRLQEVCVTDQNVSRSGDVAALCPHVRCIDVSRNLFANWREIIHLCAQLPDLSELNVSKNRMIVDLSEDTLSQLSIHFTNLEKVIISHCNYEWHDILTLSHLWPNVKQVIASYNRVEKIIPPDMTMDFLEILWLDGNPVKNWREVLNLGCLKGLKVLGLNDCLIEEIRFAEAAWNEKVDVFEHLEVLFLNRNKIKDWQSIGELNKLKSLRKLYFLKNPVHSTEEDYDTVAQLVIAKVGGLQELNGSTITPEARRGAEYDYMKLFGKEWYLSQATPQAHASFNVLHPRFTELVKKYGLPDENLFTKKRLTTTLTSQLLEITLRDESGKELKKKFPSSMSVQKLATLAQRLFSKRGNTGALTLYCVDEQMKKEFPLDNLMKELSYFSIKDGDVIHIRFR